MPPIANGPAGRGLHLGWIPNEPGRRPRDYPQAPPTAAGPDPAKLRRVQDGQHWSGLRRVLVVAGVLALILLGGIGVASHKALFWEVAVGLAVASWLGTIISAWSHRRAVRALDKDQAQAAERHGQALEAHAAAVSAWAEAEAERVAGAPHWLRVSSPDSASRLDVFGGSVRGRSGMLAGVGGSLLERHAVIVLDLSAERVCDGLIAAAEAAGLSYHDYQLPRDLRLTPLLGGLPGEQVASQIVEVMHADDPTATAAGRATDLMVLRKIIAAVRVAGTGSPGPADGDGDGDITMRHLHEALACVLAGSPVAAGPGRPGPPGPATALGQDAVAALAAQFPGEFRREVAASLIRLAAVVEPLRDLGADAAPPPPARLTCLSLEEGPRDVASDLTAAFVVQWATQAILAAATAGGGGPSPAVVVAGAGEQAARHLQRLTAVCERYGIPLIRTFSRLSEESARHLDTRNTGFMTLATRAEALRAAEHIGLERRFVAGRFSHTRSVSQSRTVTRGESITHTTGTSQGEAVTKTTGTTTGEALSESVVQRHNDRVLDRPAGGSRGDDSGRDNSNRRPAGPRGNVSGDPRKARGAAGAGGGGNAGGGKAGRDLKGKDLSDKDIGDKDIGGRVDAAKGGKPRPAGKAGGKQGSGRQPRQPRQPAYVFDFIASRTKYKFAHESEAKTESFTRTEETSRTQTRELAKTDGTTSGDEVTYELTYDHKVAPETLMSLPEDQMLAPHVVERSLEAGAADAGAVGAGANAGALLAGPVDRKMIALVVNPEIIGSSSVAQVRPGEIPAFRPPPPLVSKEVPEPLRALRPGGHGQ